MSAYASLTPKEKAELVLDLQRGGTSDREEKKIEEIFLCTEASELTELKDRIDHGDDHRDMQQLIYHDIDDACRRQRIIEHVRVQSQRVRHNNGGRIAVKVTNHLGDEVMKVFRV